MYILKGQHASPISAKYQYDCSWSKSVSLFYHRDRDANIWHEFYIALNHRYDHIFLFSRKKVLKISRFTMMSYLFTSNFELITIHVHEISLFFIHKQGLPWFWFDIHCKSFFSRPMSCKKQHVCYKGKHITMLCLKRRSKALCEIETRPLASLD